MFKKTIITLPNKILISCNSFKYQNVLTLALFIVLQHVIMLLSSYEPPEVKGPDPMLGMTLQTPGIVKCNPRVLAVYFPPYQRVTCHVA